MPDWPKEKDADTFYGNPRGLNGKVSPNWVKQNLLTIAPPFKMFFDKQLVKKVTIHKKCASSLGRVLDSIWQASGQNQDQIDNWGVSIFAGTFNFRLKKSGSTLSMHAYACAIDLDPVKHPFGSGGHPWQKEVADAFAAENWVNLAHDQMHFQAAIV